MRDRPSAHAGRNDGADLEQVRDEVLGGNRRHVRLEVRIAPVRSHLLDARQRSILRAIVLRPLRRGVQPRVMLYVEAELAVEGF